MGLTKRAAAFAMNPIKLLKHPPTIRERLAMSQYPPIQYFPMNGFQPTRKLISIPSISGNEKAVAEFLAEYLEDKGFDVEVQETSDDRPNVYARKGEPNVVLSTHTDTVPPYVEFREDDDFIYGRGACDTKGIIAAMLKAAEALIELKTTDFGL